MNNNPTVSDVLNTTPAWGFPAGLPAGDTVMTPGRGAPDRGSGPVRVGGIGAYFFWNNLIYGEMAVYRTARKGVTQFLGAGLSTDPVIQGVAPYWRLFLQQQWGKRSRAGGPFRPGKPEHLGGNKPPTLDADGNVIPPGPGNPRFLDTNGPIDRYTDLGFDAQYQFIGKKHLFTVQTSYIHEDQKLNDTFSQDGVHLTKAPGWTGIKIKLPTTTIAPTTGAPSAAPLPMSIIGAAGDPSTPILTPPKSQNRLYGQSKPNSDYWIFELDYVPWWKQFVTKFTLQYTAYSHFNGGRSRYDGNGNDHGEWRPV